MKNLLILLCLLGLSTSLYARPAMLYIYGDVSAEGDVPSGEKPAFHAMRLNDTSRLGMSDFKAAIEELGFEIEERYDAETEFTEALLKKYQVLILSSNQRLFTAPEVQAVHRWIRRGGGLIAWSDSAFGGHFGKVGIANTLGRASNNVITAPLGMFFLSDNGGGNYLISNYEEDHFLNDYNKNGGVRYRGEGVSCVRVSAPARMLATLQAGGLGGNLKVNAIDAPFNPKTDAALAVAEIGKGRVIGNFDRNSFWNAGDGSRLSHVDNREFTQRLMVWAAGLEKEMKIISKPLPKSGILNQPPTVSAGADQTIHSLRTRLIGTTSDDGQPKRFPDVHWIHRKSRGQSAVHFVNNNPNTPEVGVEFENPGIYRFFFIANDGEFSVRDEVRITVRP